MQSVGYAYGLDDMPSAVTFENGKQLSYSYDALGRLSTSRINTTAPIVNSYTFDKTGDGSLSSDKLS